MIQQFAFIGSGFSYVEMIFIFMAILVLFGPRKLPEVFRTFGNLMTQLRTASREFKMQVMDVENQIKAEVRDIEKTIEKEAKALEDNDSTEDGEYSFEDDPYHADMHDDATNGVEDPFDHPDHADMDMDHHSDHHNVWEDDYSEGDCPEDRARRELETAARSLEEEATTTSSTPTLDEIANRTEKPVVGAVPAHEIPPELQLPDPPPQAHLTEPNAFEDQPNVSTSANDLTALSDSELEEPSEEPNPADPAR